jgi:excisionase family DNA binding protein
MQEPIFHTVREAAEILRVDAATIYRSIRAGSFPAVRIRTRYVVPAAALRAMAATAVDNGGCVDVTGSAVPVGDGACRCIQPSRSRAARSCS